MTTKPNLALLVQCETEFGSYYMKAHVVVPQENGELHNPSWDYDNSTKPGKEFEGFQVSCYVGQADYISGDRAAQERALPLWGFGVYYAPSRISTAKQAQAIARVLARIEKGQEELRQAEGYIAEGDFAGYVLRIAKILKINGIYVRNSNEQRNRSGDWARKTDGAGLQYWVKDKADLVREGKKHEVMA